LLGIGEGRKLNRKAVSGIMLTLLLIGMLTLVFNLQPAKANLETNKVQDCFSSDNVRFISDPTSHDNKGYKEQARIVEHRITTLEIDELKRKIGVWEQSENYNQMINGHGTGLRPPTDTEWAEFAGEAYVVEEILLNPLADPPTSVDLTDTLWFPPIGNQDGEGSCTPWAVGYYVKTFQEAKEHGWNLTGAQWFGGYIGFPTPEYQDRIISPDFIYHLINGGADQGSSFYDAINLVCTVGASSWEKMPYDPADSSSWPSEEAWREAPLYRGNSSGLEYLDLITDDDLTSLKNWIASDNLAVIGVDAGQYSSLSGKDDLWTLDNYANPSVNHANTIVGYRDNMFYMEEGEIRLGAFKIANSWGEGFTGESTPDGYYWISYEAMKQRVEYCMFYRDKIGYDPKLAASFEMDHSKRGECYTLIGMGNHSTPLAIKSFSDLIDGGNQPFCSNNIVFDITEFEDVVPTVINQSFYMQVFDRGMPPGHTWYSDGTAWSWFRFGQNFSIPETGATLNFQSYCEIELDWDYGYVEVHDLDADEWFTLPGLKTTSTLPEVQDNPNCPAEVEPSAYHDAGRWNAFTGVSAMYEETMDLTPFANHTIDLYFTYWTDGFELEHGWYVDDIEIPEIGFFDDVESGPNDWTYNGWSIITPSPSPNGTVLSFSIEYYDSYTSGSPMVESTSHDPPVDTINLDYMFADLILTIAGDLDGDGDVDPDDFAAFAGAYGTKEGDLYYNADCDLDGDGDVDPDDFAIFAGNYGKTA